MLLGPYEKQLHLPPVAVRVGDGRRRNDEVVRQEIESLVRRRIVIPGAA